MLFRQPVWGRSDYPLDLNPAKVSLFRLWLQCAGVSLFVVALLGFSLLVVASSFCFFRPSERNVREFQQKVQGVISSKRKYAPAYRTPESL